MKDSVPGLWPGVGTTVTVQVFYTDATGTAESPTSEGYVVLMAG